MKLFDKKSNIKDILFFAVLLTVSFVVLFYKLSTIPSGFYVDEALHSYNAYSILLTGKDEYGKFLPLVFRFYGSYNAPLFVYLTVIPIKIWGLTIFSGRFISALSALLSVIVIYFFLKKLKISTLGALFFSITPWLVFQGRIGYEVALAFFLFSLGSFLLWLSIDKNKYLIPSFIALSLSMYSAYAEKFIVPVFLLLFFVIFRKKMLIKSRVDSLIKALLVLFLLQIPNLYLFITPSFFPKSDLIGSGNIIGQANKLLSIFPSWVAFLLSFIREFLSQYVNYFSPRTLFLTNDPDIVAIPDFYPWMVIPFVLGLFSIKTFKNREWPKFIGLLIFLTPIPAALTKDPFSTHRAMPVLLPLTLLISQGIDNIFKITKNLNSVIKYSIVSLVFIFSAIFLWRSYFVLFPYENAKQWQYGYGNLVAEIKSYPNTHFLIDLSRRPIPYIELAFYMKYPPSIFQKDVDQNIKYHYYDNLPFNPIYNFGQIETRNIDWRVDPLKKQILVGDEYAISEGQAKEHFLTKVFEIRDPRYEIVFEGYETNPEKILPNSLAK